MTDDSPTQAAGSPAEKGAAPTRPEQAPADDSPRPLRPRQWRPRGSWEAVGAIAGVVSLLAGVVIGVMQLRGPQAVSGPEPTPASRATGAATSPPVGSDEALELVEVEFGDGPPAAGRTQWETRPLVVTLRNGSDEPAVLTGVKLVVHDTYKVPTCGLPVGGGIAPTYDYEFRFPVDMTTPWVGTGGRNFLVAPRSVDALSVTMGPDESGNQLLWRFSLSGIFKGGREVHWGDGVGMEGFDVPAAQYEQYAAGFGPVGTPEDMRRCGAETADRILAYTSPSPASPQLIYPLVPRLLAGYEGLAKR
jgi:hypothetical protein